MKLTTLSTRLLPLALLCGLAPLASAQTTTGAMPTVITTVPYTITTGGRYIVGHNLFNASGGASPAITVNANNVNLDLNGYFVTGGGGNNQTVIEVNGGSGVMIKNGTVANGVGGIVYSGNGLRDEMLDKVTTTHCEIFGVRAVAAVVGGVIHQCVFSSIGTTGNGYGLYLTGGWKMQDCVIDTIAGGTSSYGVFSNGNDLLLGNTISNCTNGIFYVSTATDGTAGKFLNNLLYNCPNGFTNGVNATGNN